MHTGRNFGVLEAIIWTRREIFALMAIAVVPTVVYALLECKWLALPWLPIALIGTAVAFVVGFKNNAAYDRLWEARQIWGAIVNSSRTWAVMARDFPHSFTSEAEAEAIRRELIYRHLAWLTALRFQLRESRTWENMDRVYNREYSKYFTNPERTEKLADELAKFLSPEEQAYVLGKKNPASHILSMQSKRLKEIHDCGNIELFRYLEMEKMVADLYTQQGKCERIKNFPYPRNYATLNVLFLRLFVIMVPFGMLQEFDKLDGDDTYAVWLTIPFSAMASWVFTTMEKIGESAENPFEGNANDVPISALSRTIEIDLREMLDETDLPAARVPENKILL